MRLFVSLVPPPVVVAALPALPVGVRRSRPGQEHVTLAFLGEVPDPAPVTAALDAVVLPRAAPVLGLRGAGRFGRAVWLGLDGDLDALAALARDVVAVVRSAGVVVDARPFRPHLTIGAGRLPEELRAYAGPRAPWPKVALVHSSPTPQGTRHGALQTWQLGPPALDDPGSGHDHRASGAGCTPAPTRRSRRDEPPHEPAP